MGCAYCVMMSNNVEFEEEFLFPTPEQFYKNNFEQIHILYTAGDELLENPQVLDNLEILDGQTVEEIIEYEPVEELEEQLEEEVFVEETEQDQAIASIVPEQVSALCCSLCLRRCPQEVAIRFESAAECQEKLKNVLHLKLELATENCAVCRTCWKLVETIADFKECCLKAAKGTKKIAKGLVYREESDSWLTEGTAELVGRMHQTVQGHMERIDRAVKSVPRKPPTRPNVIIIPLPAPAPTATEENGAANSDEESDNAVQEIVVRSCSKCQRLFDTESGLKIHTGRCKGPGEDEESWHTCKVCSASFKGVVHLNYHMNKHKGIKPFKCRKSCEKTFYSAMTRINHEKSCGSTGRVCQICGAVLKSEGTLKNHMAYIHGQASLPCTVCSQLFKSQKALRRHVLVHSGERKHPCNVCGKAFKTNYAARVHMRIHTQEKPFQCELCPEAFAVKCLLKAHVSRIHEANEEDL